MSETINKKYVADFLELLTSLDKEAVENLLALKVDANDIILNDDRIHFYDGKLTIFGVIAGMTSDDAPYSSIERPSSQVIIDYFNSILDKDNENINKLINVRVNVNSAVANHPDIIVLSKTDDNGNIVESKLGLLGVLNAIVKNIKDGFGEIGVEYLTNYNVVGFSGSDFANRFINVHEYNGL